MEAKAITFENLPQAVSTLIEQVGEIRVLIEKERTPVEKRMPIGIDVACQVLQKAKPTIYALVRIGKLPSYKKGKKLYFFEDELLAYIENGRRKTTEETEEELNNSLFKTAISRPTYRDRHNSKK
jgi:excisionase family DNA binding protein